MDSGNSRGGRGDICWRIQHWRLLSGLRRGTLADPGGWMRGGLKSLHIGHISKRVGCGINREGGIVANLKVLVAGLTSKGVLSRIQKGRMRDEQGSGHCRGSKKGRLWD